MQFQCQMFVASWTGVVRYHGPRPVNRPNHVWVCNHTSMIDYIILCAYSPFAVIMQLHPGWVGFLQTRVLNCLGCLWFNRTEVRPQSIHPSPPDMWVLQRFPISSQPFQSPASMTSSVHEACPTLPREICMHSASSARMLQRCLRKCSTP